MSGSPRRCARAYDDLRRRLADELGVDPSALLQQRHAELLAGPASGPSAWVPVARTAHVRPRRSSVRESLVEEIGALVSTARLVSLVGPGGVGKTACSWRSGTGCGRHGPIVRWSCASWRSPMTRRPWTLSPPCSAWIRCLGSSSAAAWPPHSARSRSCCCSTTARARARRRRRARRRAVAALPRPPHRHLVTGAAAPSRRARARRSTARHDAGWHRPRRRPAVPGTCSRCNRRVSARRPAGALGSARSSAVSTACRSIELAAARLHTLSLDKIAAGLDQRFDLLSSGFRGSPRHGSLGAAISWSFDLLDEQEREVFGDVCTIRRTLRCGS